MHEKEGEGKGAEERSCSVEHLMFLKKEHQRMACCERKVQAGGGGMTKKRQLLEGGQKRPSLIFHGEGR